MPHLVWSTRSIRDLKRLRASLSQFNPDAARRAVRTIRQSLRQLEQHPDMGRHHSLDAECREWIIPFGASAYVVLYGVTDEAVRVYAIRHAREDGY